MVRPPVNGISRFSFEPCLSWIFLVKIDDAHLVMNERQLTHGDGAFVSEHYDSKVGCGESTPLYSTFDGV